ncbi:MAG: endo-1,4-beta-xylanase, partial [Elusimicrobia bacterium]|nr:endo-1,4-beta-xylanase [Elusimicrobiota bacterium]
MTLFARSFALLLALAAPARAALTVAWASPAEGAQVDGVVRLEAAADGLGTEGSVELQADGATLREAGQPPFSADWDTAGLSEGEHTLAAIARDGRGSQATVLRRVKVKRAAPAVGELRGKILLDGNANGVPDPGEPYLGDPAGPACPNDYAALAGFGIDYAGPASGSASTDRCSAVSGHAIYSLPALPPGRYTVTLRAPDGWPAVSSPAVAADVVAGAQTVVIFAVTWPPGELRGKLLIDDDGDGVFDPGERWVREPSAPACPPDDRAVAGFRVEYAGPRAGVAAADRCSTVSGHPIYSSTGLPPGRYDVRLSAPDGWSVLGSSRTAVDVLPGQQTVQLFSVRPAGAGVAQPLACPSGPFTLSSGTWRLAGRCEVRGGVTLGGTAELRVEEAALAVDGDVVLEGRARLTVARSTFTLANHRIMEHEIRAAGDAAFELVESRLVTNGGVAHSLTSHYRGAGRSRFVARGSSLDQETSWLLADLTEEATLETTDSPHVPCEAYPSGAATLAVRGERSDTGVWLAFGDGQWGRLADLPAGEVYTWRFGRATPAATNVGYQLEVENGHAGLGVIVQPGSDVTIRENPVAMGIAFAFQASTSPQGLSGLRSGIESLWPFPKTTPDLVQTRTIDAAGRRLELASAKINFWQLYAGHNDAAAVIRDSVVNELGTMTGGAFDVARSTLQFAVISGAAEGARIHIASSTILTQSIVADENGWIVIEDSRIHGSRVEAGGDSRVLLLNNALLDNVENPFNAKGPSVFAARERAAIVALGLAPLLGGVARGATVQFRGDVIVESPLEALRGWTYELQVSSPGGRPVTVVAASTEPKRGEALGTLDTSALAAGPYLATLRLNFPGGGGIEASRAFVLSEAPGPRARLSLYDAQGRPTPKAELSARFTGMAAVGVFPVDADYAPAEHRVDAVEDGLVTLSGLSTAPLRVHFFPTALGFGRVKVYADAGGAGYPVPASGEWVLDLPLEAARSRIAKAREVLRKSPPEAFSRNTLERLTLAQDLLDGKVAGAAGPAERAHRALGEALWAGEQAALEAARWRIRGRAKREAFAFGGFLTPDFEAWDDTRKAAFTGLFRLGVANSFYLADYEREKGVANSAGSDARVAWLESEGLAAKGHPLVYLTLPNIPAWLKDAGFETLKEALRTRIRREVGRYRGRVGNWDILNEGNNPSRIVTQEQIVELARMAAAETRAADPLAVRTVNVNLPTGDALVSPEGRQAREAGRAAAPLAFLRRLSEAGVDFDAVGLQLYYPGLDMLELDLVLDRFAALGKPLHLTELAAASAPGLHPGSRFFQDEGAAAALGGWHGPWSEANQADWAEQLYTLAYAHPGVSAAIWTDLTDDFWPYGGLLRPDGTPKEAHDRLKGLLGAWGHVSPSTRTASDPDYLAFQFFTYGDESVFPPSSETIDERVAGLVRAIGETGSPSRKLAAMLGPLTFDHSDAELAALIDAAFSIALTRGVAVGFHLDDSMFWKTRAELWGDPSNVEWLDWEGTPGTGRRIDWDESMKGTKLAPQMCFNAPAVVAEVKRRASVIGRAIRRGLDRLDAAGRPELFAGAIAGWETHIGRDYATNARLGYCALSNRGFSRARPPADPDAELEGVVREFIELWADGLAAEGVPRERLYAHVAMMSRAAYGSDPRLSTTTYSQANHFAPPSVSFGRGFRPGFTTYPATGLFPELHEELRVRGTPRWASSEGSRVSPGNATRERDMETYLGRMLNHGAALVNVFAWGMGPDHDSNYFRRAAESEEAKAAYRKFLRGEPLRELPPPAVSILRPAPGAEVTGLVEISATAEPADAILRLELRAGSEVIAATTSASVRGWWDSARAPAGEVRLAAVAYDTAGNPSSKTIGVHVSSRSIQIDEDPEYLVFWLKWDDAAKPLETRVQELAAKLQA